MKFIIKYFTLFIKRFLIINTILLSGLFISNGQAAPDSTICPQQEVDVSSLYLSSEGECGDISVTGTNNFSDTIRYKSNGNPLSNSPSATNTVRLVNKYYAPGTYTLTRSCTNDSDTQSRSMTVKVLDYTDEDTAFNNKKCVENITTTLDNTRPKGLAKDTNLINYSSNNNYGNNLVNYFSSSTFTTRCRNGANPENKNNLNHNNGGIFYSNGSTTNNTPFCNIFNPKPRLESSLNQIETECTQATGYKLWFAKNKKESQLSDIAISDWKEVKSSSNINTSYNYNKNDIDSGNNIFQWNGAYATTSKGLFKLTCYYKNINTNASTTYKEFLNENSISASLSCNSDGLSLKITCTTPANRFKLSSTLPSIGDNYFGIIPNYKNYTKNNTYKLYCWEDDNIENIQSSNNSITIDNNLNCNNTSQCTAQSSDTPPVTLVGTPPNCVCPTNSTYSGQSASLHNGKCNDTSSECPQKESFDSPKITISKNSNNVCVCQSGIFKGLPPAQGSCNKDDTCKMNSLDNVPLKGTPPACYCTSGLRATSTPLDWNFASGNYGYCNRTSQSCNEELSADFASIKVNGGSDCVCQAGQLIGEVPEDINGNKYCRTNWCAPGVICEPWPPIACPDNTVLVGNTCKYKYVATTPTWDDPECTSYAANNNYNFFSKLSGYGNNYNTPADNSCSIELKTRTGPNPGSYKQKYLSLESELSFSTSSLYRYYNFYLSAGSSTAWCVFPGNLEYKQIENKCAAPAGIKLVANPSTLYLSGAQTKLLWNITDNKGKSCKLWGGQYGSYNNNNNLKIGTSTPNLPYTYSTTTNKIINPTNYSITCVDAAGKSTTTQQVKVNIFSRGEV